MYIKTCFEIYSIRQTNIKKKCTIYVFGKLINRNQITFLIIFSNTLFGKTVRFKINPQMR